MFTSLITIIKNLLQRIPSVLKYIIILFIATRLVLALVGFSSQSILYPFHGQKYDVWHYSEHKILDIWGVWDTGWYLGIAQGWYSPSIGDSNTPVAGQANYAFFPLYPALIRGLHYIVGDYFIASLIISNLALLIGCYLLYKLVKLDYDEETAKRSIKYLLIYPVSFILSGAFSEALYLTLIPATFYFAKTNRWFFAGLCGFFLSLTRSIGVFALLPLLYIYIQNNINYKSKIYNLKSTIWLLFIPIGLGVWMLYNYHLTGDYLAFAHIQEAWKREYGNPFVILFQSLTSEHLHIFISATSALAVIVLTMIYAKKIGLAYWLIGIYSIFVPLSTGIYSLPRLSLAAFPTFIILAIMGKNKTADQLLTIILAILLGFFMVFWVDGFGLIV